MTAYYNENEPYAVAWLRNLIAEGLIAPGEVDDRSIHEVTAGDLKGFTQCHFFAGLGGWSLGARLAGWPDERPAWSGSCPCQPYSVAGEKKGQADDRDLWPVWFNLIAAAEPTVVFGEQVAAAIGHHWLDRVYFDMETKGYSVGSAVLPACAVDAPHRRDRLFIVADRESGRRRDIASEVSASGEPEGQARGYGGDGAVGNADDPGSQGWRGPIGDAERPGGQALSRSVHGIDMADTAGERREVALLDDGDGAASHGQRPSNVARKSRSPWASSRWLIGGDGKARRFEPSIRLLANGVPARVGKLRALGNAIVPQVAAEVIAAFMEVKDRTID